MRENTVCVMSFPSEVSQFRGTTRREERGGGEEKRGRRVLKMRCVCIFSTSRGGADDKKKKEGGGMVVLCLCSMFLPAIVRTLGCGWDREEGSCLCDEEEEGLGGGRKGAWFKSIFFFICITEGCFSIVLLNKKERFIAVLSLVVSSPLSPPSYCVPSKEP